MHEMITHKMKSYKILLTILILVVISINCEQRKSISSESKLTSDTINSKDEITLTEKQKRILDGAKQNLKDEAKYDLSMAYYVLKYKDGEFKEVKVYPGGDLDPKIGVCTDVIIRSLRNAKIVDLQEAVQKDISANKNNYPFSRWGNKKPDSNIDHRRVMNLEVWFANHWSAGDMKNFLPGDIVVWDMNEDGTSDHIGIVSDKKEGERYFVIHNHPDPGHIAEEDKLFKWKVVGHFRMKE